MAVCVRKHVELERKVDRLIDLGSRTVVPALLVLKTLRDTSASYFKEIVIQSGSDYTLSWIDKTLGRRLMLV